MSVELSAYSSVLLLATAVVLCSKVHAALLPRLLTTVMHTRTTF